MDDYNSQDILKELFEGNSLQQFGIDPIKQFTKHFRGTIRSWRPRPLLIASLGGLYSKDVYGYKKFVQTMLDQLHSLKIKRDRLNLLQKSLASSTTTEFMTEITHDIYYEKAHDKPLKKKERSGGVIQKLTDDPKKSRKRKEREQTSDDDENGHESKRQKLVSIALTVLKSSISQSGTCRLNPKRKTPVAVKWKSLIHHRPLLSHFRSLPRSMSYLIWTTKKHRRIL